METKSGPRKSLCRMESFVGSQKVRKGFGGQQLREGHRLFSKKSRERDNGWQSTNVKQKGGKWK